MVININGGDRISYTYDEVNDETGEPVSQNNKKSFYVVNNQLMEHITAIKTFIRNQKLNNEN